MGSGSPLESNWEFNNKNQKKKSILLPDQEKWPQHLSFNSLVLPKGDGSLLSRTFLTLEAGVKISTRNITNFSFIELKSPRNHDSGAEPVTIASGGHHRKKIEEGRAGPKGCIVLGTQ